MTRCPWAGPEDTSWDSSLVPHLSPADGGQEGRVEKVPWVTRVLHMPARQHHRSGAVSIRPAQPTREFEKSQFKWMRRDKRSWRSILTGTLFFCFRAGVFFRVRELDSFRRQPASWNQTLVSVLGKPTQRHEAVQPFAPTVGVFSARPEGRQKGTGSRGSSVSGRVCSVAVAV